MTERAIDLKKGKKVLIAPSILSADPLSIGDSIRALDGEDDWIHVDIMDGHFVPNLSYGPMIVKALRRGFRDKFLDVHLMVEPAEDFIDMFIAAGPDILTVQVEAARHIHRALGAIRASGARPGVCIDPGTSMEMIEPVLHMVDLVLVMTINPGFGGQKFLPETLLKIKSLVRAREVRSLDFLIEADGGVNPQTAKDLSLSGCDVLVAGSAIFEARDPASAARAIRSGADVKWSA
ncbi:MAG: ribulose-phosphate 3-epimerase [Synergistaceae bacterium]|nr:ribulose-phosphate 3-epimerase [Synergistaceae bacterium]